MLPALPSTLACKTCRVALLIVSGVCTLCCQTSLQALCASQGITFQGKPWLVKVNVYEAATVMSHADLA